jgi:hypothetical protein
MKLKSAARYFDDTPVYDGYTGAFLFNCQFSSFNDANAVGSTSTRRILSIAPGLVVPTRRVIKVFDDHWLVGDGNPDSWKGQVIRQSFNMKKTTALVSILTPGQACLGQAGTQAYAQAIYFKDDVSPQQDANYDTFWNYFLAPVEPVSRGTILRDGSRHLRARGAYLPLEDLRIAQCDETDSGPVSVTFETGAYNPTTDSFASGPQAAPVILLDFPKAYRFQTSSASKEQPGDIAALVAASSLTPSVGKAVTIAGAVWRIVALSAEQDAWLLHLRRGA